MIQERLKAILRNKDETVMGPYDYFALVAPGEWRVVFSKPLREMLKTDEEEMRDTVMSMRLGTGIMGELDCRSGDSKYVPKNRNEVIIGIGRRGWEALMDLGAKPCITCLSGRWLARHTPERLSKTLNGNLDLAVDKAYLVKLYDARNQDWQQITSLGISPERLYVPAGLSSDAVAEAAEPFKQGGVRIPIMGYYDITKEGKDKFRPYV